MKGYGWLRLRALATFVFLVSSAASAQTAVTQTTALSFGSFVARTGGTVQVTTSGARLKTGGVMLVPQRPGTAGGFQVTGGVNGLTYSITLPTSAVLLSNGTSTMAVNGFLSSPTSVTMNSAGSQTFTVGATLTVGSAQPPGMYTGSYTLTVQYP